jgi:hypothetical protein
MEPDLHHLITTSEPYRCQGLYQVYAMGASPLNDPIRTFMTGRKLDCGDASLHHANSCCLVL